MCARSQQAPPPDVDSVVAGRYRLLRLIGEGGFARVFLAEQLSVGRRVAIKFLQRNLDPTWDAVKRFQVEARLLASVRSPALVEIHDIGRTETNDPFIVMEYVEGRTLAQVLKAHKRLDPVRAIHILVQVAGALAAVHEAGAVHRDLKPSNIMLVRGPGGRERIKIFDFGLAKALTPAAGDELHKTNPGIFVGTPRYMAPEQVDGSAVDARADLYALGLIAYVMLTGVHPFEGSGEDTTMQRRVHEEVRPLRQACPHANIPEPLERLVMRALARDPAARFATAEEMQAELVTIAAAEGMGQRDLLDAKMAGGLQVQDDGGRRRLSQREWALVSAILFVVGVLVGLLAGR